uniref:Splicing factor, arginine/serine-rich, putative n=1 Tax=Arundo donax TaxID=35708 RepID=A0A0A9H083_ARUDO
MNSRFDQIQHSASTTTKRHIGWREIKERRARTILAGPLLPGRARRRGGRGTARRIPGGPVAGRRGGGRDRRRGAAPGGARRP